MSVLETWNWYAAKSTDGGANFSYVDPFTAFPASYGGFCCDQLAYYEPTRDLYIWVLQYVRDGTGNNAERLAVAKGASAFAQPGASGFRYWDITPQQTDSPNGIWFDQPKISTTDNKLFLEISKYNTANPAQFQSSHVLRFSLDDLATKAQGESLSYSNFVSSVFSPGLTMGAAGTMYFAGHVSNSTLRVFSWPENANTVGFSDVTHSAHPPHVTPDCRRTGTPASANWCERGDHRIMDGWVAGGVIGFNWIGSQGTGGLGTFPYPYVHVVRLNETTKALLSEPIIWNQNFAFAFPSIAPNARGHLGGTVLWGGGAHFENCAGLIWDNFSPGNSWELAGFETSNADPAEPKGGDYTTTRINGGNNSTWSGGCYALRDGGTNASVHTYYVSFGRAQDDPRPKGIPVADFDGDGDTDFSVWRPSNGTWYAFAGLTEQWGIADDVPVPGQYDADAATDVAVWRPTDGTWYVKGGVTQQWGISSDVPVPGDYDGDGDTDFAVWRPADGTWYVHGGMTEQWGISSDIPVPGQYDADPATDIAVWRPSTGTWYVKGGATQQWGISTDVPVPGDYDGDGDTEFAVWRPADGTWYVHGGVTQQWGISTDVPVPGQYDADPATEIAAWRPSSGTWYVFGGATQQWGISSDKPLPVPPAIARLLFP